jgi:hypothetical protein
MLSIDKHLAFGTPERGSQMGQPQPKRTEEEAQVRRVRKRGHPSTMIGFRCPDEILEVADREGTRTEGVVALLDRAVDARSVLGEAWVEVIVRAHREGITEGEALGRIALEAIQRDRKTKR